MSTMTGQQEDIFVDDRIEIDVLVGVEDNELPPPIEFEEDMPFSSDNQKWIQDEIAKAVNELRPHGWRKLLFKLREYGALAIPITIILALLGMVITLGMAYVNRSTAEAVFQTNTNNHFTSIENTLTAINQKISNMQLSTITTLPVTKQTVKQAADVVASAKQTGEKLNPELVSAAGQKLAEAAVEQPEAWSAALAFVDYKSFANVIPSHIPTGEGADQYGLKFALDTPSGMTRPVLHARGREPKATEAQLEPIGEPTNLTNQIGVRYIYLDGGAIQLDGLRLRSVVLRNVHVYYQGGPVQLTSVYFINCTFEMKPDRNTQRFAIAALSPDPATSFNVSQPS